MLITIEGIDGSGKSTLYNGLKERLMDLDIVFTREPGCPHIGDAVRRVISENSDPLAEAALFLADHAVHTETVIRPALNEGKIIISDRYTDSRFAYQQITLKGYHKNPKSWLESVHKDWSVRPDLTILLTIDPKTALSRISDRDESEHFEKEDFLREVQINYLERVKEDPSRFLVIDANQSPKTILDFAEKTIRYRAGDDK